MTETTKNSLLSILKDRRDEILDEIIEAEASAMTYCGFVYTVRIWEDGTIQRVEKLSGDNSYPAADGWMNVFTSPVCTGFDWMDADSDTIDSMTDGEIRQCAIDTLTEDVIALDSYEWWIDEAIRNLEDDRSNLY